MNRMDLNHVLMKREINEYAFSLLVIGGLLSVGLFFYYQQLVSQNELLQIEVQQRTQAPIKSRNSRALLQLNTKEDGKKHDEIIAVNAAIKEIVLPWPALFKTLEAASRDGVKLLALQPNAKQRILRITAVALDVDSMIAYVDELTQQKTLKEVALLSQEFVETNGQKTVQFVVEAVWAI